MTSFRRHILAGQGGGGVLPSEYQQVEWLQLGKWWVNNMEYCNVKIPYENWNVNCVVELDGALNGGSFGTEGYLTGQTSRYNGAFIISSYSTNTNSGYMAFGKNNWDGDGVYTPVPNQRRVLKVDKSGFTVDGVFQAWASGEKTETWSPITINIGHPPAGKWTDNDGSGKFYEFSLKDNGELVIDLLPCYRKADNADGLYDINNKTFYPADGVHTPIRGRDVN